MMSSTSTPGRHRIGRRSFLTTLAAGAAAASSGALLAGCGGGSPSSSSGSATKSSDLAGILPAYIPVEYVKPDLPGVNGSAPGYLTFPQQLVRSVTATPASGSAQAMTPAYWPIPPQPNAYFDEVNKRLGATVKFTIVAGNDYKAKLAATTAGGNVPDLTVVTQWDQPARMSEAVGALFADLFDMRVFPPYSAAGIPPGYLVADPARIFCFISKKASPQRIDELLGILDFCAAPFGTQEHYLINYGIEGVHHTRGADGVPQMNKKGSTEVTPTYFFLAGRPDALTQVQIPEYVKARHAWESLAVNHQVKQVYHGLRVEEPARFTAARAHYKRAVVFAVEAKSAALRTYMLGSAAAWSAAGGQGTEAVRLVREARPFAVVSQHSTARAWLAATEALAHAAAGERHATLEALDHAEDVIGGESDLPRWPWIYAFDRAKVEQYRATCYTTLGMPDLAIPALRRSLDGLSPSAGKQRALLLASLARMALLQREIDQSAAFLAQAFELGTATGSRRIVEHVREVRVGLGPWESTAAVRALDKQLVGTFLARPGTSR